MYFYINYDTDGDNLIFTLSLQTQLLSLVAHQNWTVALMRVCNCFFFSSSIRVCNVVYISYYNSYKNCY